MSGVAMAAGDAEVEALCFNITNGDGQKNIFCETVNNLKAECALVDPEDTTEICQDANAVEFGQDGALVNMPDHA